MAFIYASMVERTDTIQGCITGSSPAISAAATKFRTLKCAVNSALAIDIDDMDAVVSNLNRAATRLSDPT